MSRLPSITAVSTPRTAEEAGSNQLAIQVVLIHAHQTMSSRNAARATPATVRSSRIWCDSCVTAKT
jgi:hypothetical protein